MVLNNQKTPKERYVLDSRLVLRQTSFNNRTEDLRHPYVRRDGYIAATLIRSIFQYERTLSPVDSTEKTQTLRSCYEHFQGGRGTEIHDIASVALSTQ